MWPLFLRVSAFLSALILGVEVAALIKGRDIHATRVYDSREASEFLKVDRKEVIRLIKSKKIAARKINRQYRITGKSLLDYLSGT